MRLSVILLLTLLAAIAVAATLHVDNGYALLSFRGTSIEMSLATLIGFALLAFVIFYAFMRIVLHAWRFPSRLSRLRRLRKRRRARRATIRALIDMAEGRWSESEKVLGKYAADGDMPLINYLSAARAAQLQGAHERRDEHLRHAYESTPAATVAVLLTQAELQIAHRQFEHALATLRRLEEINPRHAYALKLLARLYRDLGDWKQLRELAPKLRQFRALPAEEVDQLEARAVSTLLDHTGAADGRTAVDALWSGVSRRLRKRPEAVAAYAQALVRCGINGPAEETLREAIKSHWDDGLVLLYGKISGDDPAKQLHRAEEWLKDHADSAALLLTSGRLCVINRLWGKARSYLESSVMAGGPPEAYEELGRLLQSLGEPERAMQMFRDGLTLALGQRVHKYAPVRHNLGRAS